MMVARNWESCDSGALSDRQDFRISGFHPSIASCNLHLSLMLDNAVAKANLGVSDDRLKN
jgi:hypothetical protein